MSSDLQIENKCHEILQSLKSSSLNYSAQITPFSIYVTVRKSLVKQMMNHPSEEAQTVVDKNPDFSSEYEIMKSRCKFLETSNDDLKVSLEQEVIANEGKSELIKRLETCLEETRRELSDLGETKSKTLTELDVLCKEKKKLLDEISKKTVVIDKLKTVNENLEKEHEISETNFKHSAKIVKTKDKEIHNMKKENDAMKDSFGKVNIELKELQTKVNRENKEKQRKEKAQAKKGVLNNQKETKPSGPNCEKWDETLESDSKLKLHMQAVHLEDTMAQTKEIFHETKLVHVQTLNIPLPTSHDKSTETNHEKPECENFSCFYCENEITSEVNLIEHRVTCQGASETPSLFSFQIRSRAIPYKCVICGLVTSTREDMVNHTKIVHGH